MAARYCYGRNISNEELFRIARSAASLGRPGLREKPLLAPRLAVAGEQHAIMQPERPVLPELDPLRPEPEAGPMRWPRHRALGGELPAEGGEAALQHLAVRQWLRLVGGPGA